MKTLHHLICFTLLVAGMLVCDAKNSEGANLSKLTAPSGNYEGALTWHKKVEERYNRWNFLVEYCIRYKQKTGDSRFRPELEKHKNKVFPNGIRTVVLKNFENPPENGVTIIDDRDEVIREPGMKNGNVIVALDGNQVGNFLQYSYLRDAAGPKQKLIIWDGARFRELESKLPNLEAKTVLRDYKPKK